MYENLPLDSLVPNPQNANRISRMFAKKLKHNIEQLGMYETLTVRSHRGKAGKFEVLNGHARLEALRALGIRTARCDIWQLDEPQAELALAILNKLRGSDVPELRMNLLLKLLQSHSKDELAAHVPETAGYLTNLQKLAEGQEEGTREEPLEKADVIIVDFYLSSHQHQVVCRALDDITRKCCLSDSSQALAKMAELYLTKPRATKRKPTKRK